MAKYGVPCGIKFSFVACIRMGRDIHVLTMLQETIDVLWKFDMQSDYESIKLNFYFGYTSYTEICK